MLYSLQLQTLNSAKTSVGPRTAQPSPAQHGGEMMKVLSRAEVWHLTLQHGAGETATNTVFMPVSSLSVWRGDRGHFVPLCAGPHLTFIQLQLVPTGQPGPGPAAPRAGSSSPHRQGHRFRYSVLLLRYCPGCILGACPSCVSTPPHHPSQYQSAPAPGAAPASWQPQENSLKIEILG